jgi:hypothetical protein
MSSEQPGFKVSDQRHFAADGSTRTSHDGAQSPAIGGKPEAEHDVASPAGARVDFSSFILSLAAQASALLHAEGADDGRSTSHEEEAVRQLIAVLEMLQDKTEARRTTEETRLLESLLFELRMAYVSRHQEGGR